MEHFDLHLAAIDPDTLYLIPATLIGHNLDQYIAGLANLIRSAKPHKATRLSGKI